MFQNYTQLEDDLAFCLGPGDIVPVVPLAPWALILATVLIGVAIVFRYYKIG